MSERSTVEHTTLPARPAWPLTRALPARTGDAADMPPRAAAASWQPRLVDVPSKRSPDGDGGSPWRVADQRRLTQWKRRRLMLSTVAAVLACVVGFNQSRAVLIARLSSDLYAERVHSATMTDSVTVIRAALDARIERFVALQPRSRDSIALPIAGRVSSGFAPKRLHPILRVWRPHRGIDIPAPTGTPVRALMAGRVRTVSRDFGYGLFIELDHGKGIRTRYAHLQSAAVARGDQVSPETILGAVGTSGLSTAPHLHYELLHHERWVDPLAFAMTMVEVVPGAIRRVAGQQRAFLDSAATATPSPPPFNRGATASRIALSACALFPSSCVPESWSGAMLELP
jgi:murein DD-endopeptidase MepM/ murein hydrolase activator NlpD